MSRVVHFELTADDPERAVKFYKDAFNWKIETWEGDVPYWLCTTGDKDKPGINGAIMKREEGAQNNFSISTDNIEESLEKIKKAGGTILSEIITIPTIGYSVYFKDTEDNLLNLFKWDCEAG